MAEALAAICPASRSDRFGLTKCSAAKESRVEHRFAVERRPRDQTNRAGDRRREAYGPRGPQGPPAGKPPGAVGALRSARLRYPGFHRRLNVLARAAGGVGLWLPVCRPNRGSSARPVCAGERAAANPSRGVKSRKPRPERASCPSYLLPPPAAKRAVARFLARAPGRKRPRAEPDGQPPHAGDRGSSAHAHECR
jgi:hypothetical protein